MNHGARLRAEVLYASRSSIWEEAIQEWGIEEVWSEPGGICACGYTPITERARVRNLETGAKLIIGRVCIKNFMNMPEVEKFFSALNRCRNDSTNIPELLFSKACSDSVIDNRSYSFLKSIHRKRKLSHKQLSWRESLRQCILRAYTAP